MRTDSANANDTFVKGDVFLVDSQLQATFAQPTQQLRISRLFLKHPDTWMLSYGSSRHHQLRFWARWKPATSSRTKAFRADCDPKVPHFSAKLSDSVHVGV